MSLHVLPPLPAYFDLLSLGVSAVLGMGRTANLPALAIVMALAWALSRDSAEPSTHAEPVLSSRQVSALAAAAFRTRGIPPTLKFEARPPEYSEKDGV